MNVEEKEQIDARQKSKPSAIPHTGSFTIRSEAKRKRTPVAKPPKSAAWKQNLEQTEERIVDQEHIIKNLDSLAQKGGSVTVSEAPTNRTYRNVLWVDYKPQGKFRVGVSNTPEKQRKNAKPLNSLLSKWKLNEVKDASTINNLNRSNYTSLTQQLIRVQATTKKMQLRERMEQKQQKSRGKLKRARKRDDEDDEDELLIEEEEEDEDEGRSRQPPKKRWKESHSLQFEAPREMSTEVKRVYEYYGPENAMIVNKTRNLIYSILSWETSGRVDSKSSTFEQEYESIGDFIRGRELGYSLQNYVKNLSSNSLSVMRNFTPYNPKSDSFDTQPKSGAKRKQTTNPRFENVVSFLNKEWKVKEFFRILSLHFVVQYSHLLSPNEYKELKIDELQNYLEKLDMEWAPEASQVGYVGTVNPASPDAAPLHYQHHPSHAVYQYYTQTPDPSATLVPAPEPEKKGHDPHDDIPEQMLHKQQMSQIAPQQIILQQAPQQTQQQVQQQDQQQQVQQQQVQQVLQQQDQQQQDQQQQAQQAQQPTQQAQQTQQQAQQQAQTTKVVSDKKENKQQRETTSSFDYSVSECVGLTEPQHSALLAELQQENQTRGIYPGQYPHPKHQLQTDQFFMYGHQEVDQNKKPAQSQALQQQQNYHTRAPYELTVGTATEDKPPQSADQEQSLFSEEQQQTTHDQQTTSNNKEPVQLPEQKGTKTDNKQ
eukprot:CAMPEP_0174276592 /NCGR_PEP_ID=MMETSP0439-20130205/60473_1 /TAXON_ID=0 /ORGANISM="Stereomyxa ramosa, Strain Chinc5" /LENGTH=708 /DNA_ID=CAMNT_0015368839 /DNA_START=331 /DNA_END=2457 /DNA_ORIENTATION=-